MSAPKPFPLSAFDTLMDKQPIGCVQGVLTKLFKRTGDTNEHGQWSIQNAEITKDGVSIPVQFKNCQELTFSWKDREIIMESVTGKTGITGLYCMDDDRGGKITRKLKVTASATLSLVGDSQSQRREPEQRPTEKFTNPAESAPDLQEPPPRSTTAEPKPKPAKASKKEEEDENFYEAKKALNKIANLHLLCAVCVERYEAPAFKKLTGSDMSESQRQGATASIFIKAERDGLVRLMPVSNAINDPRFAASE